MDNYIDPVAATDPNEGEYVEPIGIQYPMNETEVPPKATVGQTFDIAASLATAKEEDPYVTHQSIQNDPETAVVDYNNAEEAKVTQGDVEVLRQETSTLDNGTRAAVMQDWFNMRNEEKVNSLKHVEKAATNSNINFGSQAVLAPEKKFSEQVRQYLFENKNKLYYDQLNKEARASIGDITHSMGVGSIAELGGLMVPFAENIGISRIDTEVFGDKHNSITKSFMLPGEYIKLWKDELMNVSGQQRLELGRKLIKAIREKSGILGSGNDLAALGYLEGIFRDIMGNEDGVTAETTAFFTNVGSIADVLTLGMSGVKGVSKLFRPAYSSHLANLALTNPLDYAKLQANILAAGAEGNVDAIVKSFVADHFQRLPGAGQMLSVNAQAIQDKAVDIATSVLKSEWMYTDEQIESVRGIISKHLANQDGASLRVNQSQIPELSMVKGETGFLVKAMYGATDNVGFPTYEDAVNTMRRLFGTDVKIKVYARNGVNSLQEVSATQSGRGVTSMSVNPAFYQGENRLLRGLDFYAEVEDMFVPIHHNNMSSQSLILGPNSVNIDNHFAASVLVDVNAALSQHMASKFGRYVDKVKGLENDINNIIKSTFLRLPRGKARKILEILQDGRNQEKIFSVDELSRMGITDPKMVDSYQSLVIKSNLEYTLSDMRYTQFLKSRGMSELNDPIIGRHFGKALKRANALDHTSTFFDPVTKTVVNLSEQQLDDLYRKGGQILETRTKHVDINTPGNKSTHVIVDPDTGAKITGVNNFGNLNYIPGYGYAQLYDNSYYLVRKSPGIKVNGKTVDEYETLFGIDNVFDGRNLEDALNASRQGDEAFALRDAREFMKEHPDLYEYADIDIINSGRPYLGHRGPGLLADIEGRAARTLNPVDAMMRSSAHVAKLNLQEQFLGTMKKSFMNEFGDLVGGVEGQKVFPFSKDMIRGTVKDRKRVANAKTMWHYINMVQSGQETLFFNAWRSVLMGAAEWVEGGGKWRTLGKGLREMAKRDPYSTMRKIPFTMWIIGNPLRQFLLQTSQAALIAGANPKYALTRLVPETTALSMLVGLKDSVYLGKNSYASVLPSLAKTLDMSVEEADKFVSFVKSSGILSTIDSNLYFSAHGGMASLKRHLGRSGYSGMAANVVEGMVNYPINYAKTIGFDWGEANMVFASTLMALRDFQKMNPTAVWTKTRNLDAILGKARQYALTMNSAGAMSYQKGVLSLMTQFLSYQHKALLTMLPTKMGGSTAFRPGQKAGMFVMNSLLFGLTGLGMREAYKFARDRLGFQIPPSLDEFAIGGMTDYVVNGVINAISDEESQLDISGTFAPAGGTVTTPYNFINALFNQETGVLDKLGGASYDSGIKVRDTVKLIKTMVKVDGYNQETALEAVKIWHTLLSGYDNYTKYTVARNMGYFVNSNGDPTVKATYVESLAKIFGINSRAHNEYVDMQLSMFGEKGSSTRQENIKGVARNYVKQLKQLLERFDKEQTTDFDELYKRLNTEIEFRNLVINMHDPLDVLPIMEEIQKILADRQLPGSVAITNTIARLMDKGGKDTEYILNRAIHSRKLFPDSQEIMNLKWFLEKVKSEKSDLTKFYEEKANER